MGRDYDLSAGPRAAAAARHRRARERGEDRLPDLQAEGGDDVALVAVRIPDERDVGGAVRIVLDGLDLRRDPDLVTAEIDDAVLPFVSAAAAPHGNAALVIASRLFGVGLEEAFFGLRLGDLGEVRNAHLAP